MICDFVHIQEASVYGIRHPKFLIRGSVMERDATWKIMVNQKPVKYNELPSMDNCGFHFEVPLNPKDKTIEVFVCVNGQETLVCFRKNSLWRRIKSKMRKFLAPVLRCLKKVVTIFVKFWKAIGRGIGFLWREHHFLVPPVLWKKYFMDFIKKMKEINHNGLFLDPLRQEDYLSWLKNHDEKTEIVKLKYNPKISMVIPVYNVSRELLSECLDSILHQSYTNFEICLADDHSSKQDTVDTLKEYIKKDKRIKVVFRKENGHISKATNDAIELATGEFIGLMDNDDLLTPDALYEVVKVLNNDKKLDMIYSDEDKMDMNGRRRDPHFKPDFSPDTLLSSNYICHFCVLRKSIVNKLGGFRVGYEGSQDHDLFLRFTECTNRIAHIPKILYHWRMIPGSTAVTIDSKSYALQRGVKAIEDALDRRHIKGHVTIKNNYYLVEYDYAKEPSISIIVPTKNHAADTEKCLDSIFKKTNYKNYEVVLVDNDSSEEALFDLIKRYQKKYSNFRVVDAKMPFNYSKINNIAIKTCKSDYIVLLNNDTELITGDWLKVMVGYAMQDHIGTVGVKLLYPDNTIQHAGVVLGVGGVANHAFLSWDRYSLGLYARLALPYNYSANTAACLMVSRKKYQEVGGLDEKLMVAYNDIDFNLKLLTKGYYNIFVPQVELYHFESKSRGLDTTTEKYHRFMEEQYYMYEKWHDMINRDPFYNVNFSKEKSFMLDKKTLKELKDKRK